MSADRQNGAGVVLRWLDDVDPRSPTPLYEQIASRIRAAVGAGVLVDRDALPSVRQLAGHLRINPATVVQAYRLLETDGFAEMRQGAGSFVRAPESDQRQRERDQHARRLMRGLLADAAKAGLKPGELKRAWDAIVEEPDQ